MALTAGIGLGWTSPVNAKLNNATRLDENPFERVLTKDELSWLGSLLALGSVFGPLLAGVAADKIGRKKTLLFVSGVPFLITYLLLAFTSELWLWYIARFVSGFAVGEHRVKKREIYMVSG